MFRSLYTAASGMMAQQLNLDNIANNLANSSTAGFRRRRLQFQDLLYQNVVMPGSAATQQTTIPSGLQIGLETRSAASEIIQLQGDYSSTGNPLDLAIEGQGFFQVRLPSGETAYTRSGRGERRSAGRRLASDWSNRARRDFRVAGDQGGWRAGSGPGGFVIGPIEALAPKPPEDGSRLRKASQEFEAMMLNFLLRPLEHAMASGPGAEEEEGNQNYASLGLEALSSALASGKGFGLGEMVLTRMHQSTAPEVMSGEGGAR